MGNRHAGGDRSGKKPVQVAGAYHFAHPGSEAMTQANHFTSVVRNANGGSFSGLLQLVLDFEVTGGRTPSQVFAWTRAFVAQVEAVTDRPCIIFPSFYFFTSGVTTSATRTIT